MPACICSEQWDRISKFKRFVFDFWHCFVIILRGRCRLGRINKEFSFYNKIHLTFWSQKYLLLFFKTGIYRALVVLILFSFTYIVVYIFVILYSSWLYFNIIFKIKLLYLYSVSCFIGLIIFYWIIFQFKLFILNLLYFPF